MGAERGSQGNKCLGGHRIHYAAFKCSFSNKTQPRNPLLLLLPSGMLHSRIPPSLVLDKLLNSDIDKHKWLLTQDSELPKKERQELKWETVLDLRKQFFLAQEKPVHPEEATCAEAEPCLAQRASHECIAFEDEEWPWGFPDQTESDTGSRGGGF